MIDCLTGYIGLKRIYTSPTSDEYVNDLPGITTNKFESIREINENDGTLEAWQTLEGRAIRSFERDIMLNLRKYYKKHQIITSGLTGYVDDNQVVDHGSGKYSGWLFDTGTFSNNMKIEINDVRLTLTSSETFNVKIFDANTGEELFTKSVSGVAGLNVIKILKSYSVANHNKLFVCYDTVLPYRIFDNSPIDAFVTQGSFSTSATILDENIDVTEVGMAVGYNIKCSIEEFVCSRLDLFTEPYLYKLGIAFLQEAKHSENFNRYTLLNSDQTDQLIADYKMTYQDLLDSTFLDLEVPDDGICFICNKMISKKVLIP